MTWPFLFQTGLLAQSSPETGGINIIPRPMKMERQPGWFRVTSRTKIFTQCSPQQAARVRGVADDLAVLLFRSTDYGLSVAAAGDKEIPDGSILFTTRDANPELGKEGYSLSVTPHGVVIRALDAHGLFYGFQSLRQLLPPQVESPTPVDGVDWKAPCVRIEDKPRYAWRGMMLDVSRHFFPVSFVKKFIDVLAMLKMNHFHWHLTDDNGWRIQIKKYPKLTQVAAWRQQYGEEYGGYYTQDEIREVVQYARQRFVTVVPEIEMPGHSGAALTAYPQLSCTGGPFKVTTVPGGQPDPYCAGNNQTFVFLENVLTEVMKLFPSKFIHVGGDEVNKTQWMHCPKDQHLMKVEGLKNPEQIQSYFMKRIEKFIDSKGRRMIGWDEILEGGLAPNAAVMSWRGTQGGIRAAQMGHDVVMSPTTYCYFDHYQSRLPGEPVAIGGFLPLVKVYSYDPTPKALSPQEAKHILGAQANLWTEYVPTPSHAEYMVLPRADALAEVVWSPQAERDFANFEHRLWPFFERLDELGYNYRVPQPRGIQAAANPRGGYDVTIDPAIPQAQIHYTTNGSAPTEASPLYIHPFYASKNQVIFARTILPDGKKSLSIQLKVGAAPKK